MLGRGTRPDFPARPKTKDLLRKARGLGRTCSEASDVLEEMPDAFL